MSEKYFTIGAPMTELPRPVTSGGLANLKHDLTASAGNLQSHEQRGGSASVRFHDCSLNASLTNIRDAKEQVRNELHIIGIC